MGDDYQLGLASLNEGGNVVETILDSLGLGGLRLGLRSGSRKGDQTGLLLSGSLGTVLVKKGEESLG